MNAEILYALTGAALVSLSLYVLVAIPHLLRKLLAFNILASGIFLMLTGLGQRGGGADPIPQALVLTGIVVSFASTALALTLMRRWFRSSGRITLDSGLPGATTDDAATDGATIDSAATDSAPTGSEATEARPENRQEHSADKTDSASPAATTGTTDQASTQALPSDARGSHGPARDWSN